MVGDLVGHRAHLSRTSFHPPAKGSVGGRPTKIPLSTAGTATRIGSTSASGCGTSGRPVWCGALVAGSEEPVGPDPTDGESTARAVTGMLRTTPVGPLVREAGMEPAATLLQRRQLGYTTRLLGLVHDHPARCILPASLREGDRHVQPGEQPEDDRVWAESQGRGPWSLGQQLARQLSQILPIDPSGGFEASVTAPDRGFPGKITILPADEALRAAKATGHGLGYGPTGRGWTVDRPEPESHGRTHGPSGRPGRSRWERGRKCSMPN